MGIVIGSVIKGLLAGYLIGYFAQKVNSLRSGILFGLGVSGFLAFLVALLQHLTQNRVYYWQIMLPGCILGIIVGCATQQFGTGGRQPAPAPAGR
jgi:ABC-type Mn2+/Zn2+ transport system permease subunit